MTDYKFNTAPEMETDSRSNSENRDVDNKSSKVRNNCFKGFTNSSSASVDSSGTSNSIRERPVKGEILRTLSSSQKEKKIYTPIKKLERVDKHWLSGSSKVFKKQELFSGAHGLKKYEKDSSSVSLKPVTQRLDARSYRKLFRSRPKKATESGSREKLSTQSGNGIGDDSSKEVEEGVVESCLSSSKRQRVDFDLEHNFFGNAEPSHKLLSSSIPLDGRELEAMLNTELTEEYRSDTQHKDSRLKTKTQNEHTACIICMNGGDLLYCGGKGCKRNYHLSCLDPPLSDKPSGVWFCILCVRKKIELGVHSVSENVQSVWDAREVVSDHEVMQRQKQYLVKYQGLAHVHNRWIPETQLLVEAPVLVAKFNRKNKVINWKAEWALPQRVLQKRLLVFPNNYDEHDHGDDDNNLDCHYEWLVKWTNLGYDHATWELENASFLRSPEALKLIEEFENRHEMEERSACLPRADEERKGKFIELSEFPFGGSSGVHDCHLSNVNQLRKYWHRGQNAVVVNDQERVVKVTLFILSLQCKVYRPFLIISTSAALSSWEAEFSRLAPSVNTVVYEGNRGVRSSIKKLEFFNKYGCLMFQVLLSSLDVIVEDLEVLACIEWEAIIIDEFQHKRVSEHYKQIKMLYAEMRLLLVTGQIKDCTTEYLSLLSFLDSGIDGTNSDGLETDSNINICILKERLTQFIAFESKLGSPRFAEFWVPVQLSNMQLEKYCATLLSNSLLLCSSWKSDATDTLCDDALREILLSIRKCCDHPYLLDQSLQNFVTDDLPIDKILDVGIRASGKLQLLDKMLLEIKSHGLRVLVIYQILGGSGLYSIGDYLDDIICRRFGRDTFIRIEGGGGYAPKKKKALLNTFNQDREKFVLLIENRACIRSVKLSSVDTVILFNSDLDPVNDLRALQRIAIDSPVEELKVFRLYSPCTIEEKALILAKEGATPESHINNIHRKTCHMLLTWGAASLFNKLDKFHGLNISISGSNIFLEESLVNEVLGEFSTLCSNENGDTSHCSVISKVQHIDGVYSRNILLHSEGKTQLVDGNETDVLFWKDLLEARHPRWKILPRSSEKNRRKLHFFDSLPNRPESESSPKRFGFRSVTVRRKRRTVVNWSSQRSRRKVKYFDSSPTRSDSESVVVRKKSRKLVNWSCQRTRLNVNLFDGSPKQRSEFGILSKGSDFGSEVVRKKCKVSSLNHIRKSVPVTKDISRVPEVNMDRYEEERLPEESAQSSFKPEISKLCRILHLPKNVEAMALRFLEYVMREYDIGWEEETTFQAFQISVCWAAAAFSKHRVDRIDSLALAKLHLNFDCQEEETNYIYSKMLKLEKKFACHIECVERDSKSIKQKEDDQKRNTCSDQLVPAINEETPDSTMVERNNVEPPHIEEPADVLDLFSMQSTRDIPLVGSVASVSESEPDLLDIEIKRIQKDKEQASKLHEDMKLQLELECAKEIEGIRTLIGKKYDVLLKDAENEFVQKKKDLATHYDKVLLNKSLAETWATYHDNSEIDLSTNMQPATTSDFIDRLIPQTRERQAPRLEQSLVSSPKIVKAPPVQVVNESSELFSNRQDRLGAPVLPMSVPNQQLQSHPHATSSRPTQLYTELPPGFFGGIHYSQPMGINAPPATNHQLLQSNPLATSSKLTQLNRLLAQHSLPVGINNFTPAANLHNPFSPLNDIFSSPRKKSITNSNK